MTSGVWDGHDEVMMTPVELAVEMGVEPIQVRRYLRERFPRSQVEKGQRWQLTDEMVDDVRAHFRSR